VILKISFKMADNKINKTKTKKLLHDRGFSKLKTSHAKNTLKELVKLSFQK